MSSAIKLVLTGDLNVGKTSIIKQFVEGIFEESVTPTICDCLSKTIEIDGSPVQIDIWDTAGQERFRTVTSSFYKGAKMVCFVYDVNNRESYDNLQHWYTEVDRCAAETSEKVLIGNKIDLDREVTRDEAEERADEWGIPYFEMSAKKGRYVHESFADMVKPFLNRDVGNYNGSVTVGKTQSGTKKKSMCHLL